MSALASGLLGWREPLGHCGVASSPSLPELAVDRSGLLLPGEEGGRLWKGASSSFPREAAEGKLGGRWVALVQVAAGICVGF